MSSKYDPWKNALVWFAESAHSVWKPGKVIKHEPAPTQVEWTFIITFEEGDSTGQVQITTAPVDSFMLEFVAVKKRDKDPVNALHITDMTSLSFLNEPEMIECLRLRYFDRHIYTSIGPILVAVNPFEQLGEGVYSAEIIEKYFNSDQSAIRALGPHVYQISNNAYSKMFIDKFDPDKRENQSILVNGESGAVSASKLMRYIMFSNRVFHSPHFYCSHL
jgi:myosin V